MAYSIEKRASFRNPIEDITAGNNYRAEYLSGIEKVLARKKAEANKKRDEFDAKLVKDIDAYREKFIEALGWPLTEYKKDGIPKVKETFVANASGVDIIRMQIEVMPDLWYYGILFKKGGEKRPLVLCQHGGEGTPEIAAGLYPRDNGEDSANYNDMIKRVLQYDVNVFAPQMLLWKVEEYGNEYNRQYIDGMLRMQGGSITAFELYALRKTLDYLEVQEYVDADKIGMVGLSYGGMYTLYMTAADTRIKSALSSSFFCDRFIHCWPDWSYKNCAATFLDAEVAMLCYPRKICIAMGDHDSLFGLSDTDVEYERIKKQGLDDKITYYPFEGTHEFLTDDDGPIESLIEDLK